MCSFSSIGVGGEEGGVAGELAADTNAWIHHVETRCSVRYVPFRDIRGRRRGGWGGNDRRTDGLVFGGSLPGELGAAVANSDRMEFQALADLYDPITMPPSLVKAHRDLDRAVDRLYRREGFETELDRVEFLFGEYQRLVGAN